MVRDRVRRGPIPLPTQKSFAVTVTAMHEVLVRGLSFAVSAEKARVVLERWWKEKERRKAYMRVRRSGAMKKREVPA